MNGPWGKRDRAVTNYEELVVAMKAFLESGALAVIVEENEETKKHAARVSRAEPIPPEIRLIAGDLIHNLRASLDHLVWQLVIASDEEPNERTAFPVWRSQAKFEAGFPGNAQGISDKSAAALKGLSPYRGGNEALWRLHKLDIIDKHRLMVTTYARYVGIELDPSERLVKALAKAGKDVEIPPMPFTLRAADTSFEIGTVLYEFDPSNEDEPDANLVAALAIDEPEAGGVQALPALLDELRSFVDETLELFTPFVEPQGGS
jgi:hypothetical protein